MKTELMQKEKHVINKLKSITPFIIAFSGGVDSTYLTYLASRNTAKNSFIALTLNSPAIPLYEIETSQSLAKDFDIRHKVLNFDTLEIINNNGNSKERCYYCKKGIFTEILNYAKSNNFKHVAEGTNKDDLNDYRPGKKALEELGILSPLLDAGLKKSEIRELSRYHNLPTWDNAASACLVSRFPHGIVLTPDDMKKVAEAEHFLHELGFKLCRVRYFNDKAVIELNKEKIASAIDKKDIITDKLLSLGFNEMEIDDKGYRTGRMN